MNDKLEQTLALVVKKGLEVAEKTGEFVLNQMTDLLHQFYTWHIVLNSLYILLSIISCIVIFKVTNILFATNKKPEKEKNYIHKFNRYFKITDWYSLSEGSSDYLGGFIAIRIATIFITTLVFIVNLIDLLKIIIAPKIYLIEYFIK